LPCIRYKQTHTPRRYNHTHEPRSGIYRLRCGAELSRRSPEVLTITITVVAIDAIRRHLATIPEKDGTARDLTRQEAIARMSTEIWPCGRITQDHDRHGYIDARVAVRN
jgi:hypothetical protein